MLIVIFFLTFLKVILNGGFTQNFVFKVVNKKYNEKNWFDGKNFIGWTDKMMFFSAAA